MNVFLTSSEPSNESNDRVLRALTEQNMSSDERNGEIWSNRVQKELLALTTDNADMQSTEVRSMIPSFTTVKNHKLDLNSGICLVLVHVDVPKKKGSTEEVQAIVISFDASLKMNADGTVDISKSAYPFIAPIVRLKEGAQHFPKGSTIRNGDRIATDLDWTPSLHLTDAILNIGLKIKESIMQKEPFHKAPEESTKRGFGFSFGKASNSISKAFSHKQDTTETSSSKDRKATVAGPPPPPSDRRGRKVTAPPAVVRKGPAPANTPGNVKIGDEINLLDEPWVNAHGVYSCKAIRRPPFIEEAMERAAKQMEQSFSSPAGMLRSFAQTTRSLMEESFLMVTESHIIELKASRLNVSSGTVAFCIPIDMMAKLKFRRQESLSLFFKTSPNDPLVYMCPDSGDAVHQIQSVLKRHGVKGKHTNAAAYKAISEAMHLVQAIQTKELALKHDPTVERVNEIMDLYRQAAERFEVAGDIRHEEVVTHMRKFLALPQTVSILDGSFKKPPESPKRVTKMTGGIPEGEVLERPDFQLYDDDDIDGHPDIPSNVSREEQENDKAFEQNIDKILKDAREDFEKFKLDDSTLETDSPSAGSSSIDELADVAADLDAMMREADKELEELMSS